MAGYGFGDFISEYVMGQQPNAMANPQMTAEEAYRAMKLREEEEKRIQAALAARQQGQRPQQGYVDNYRQQYVDPREAYLRQLQMAGQYGN